MSLLSNVFSSDPFFQSGLPSEGWDIMSPNYSTRSRSRTLGLAQSHRPGSNMDFFESHDGMHYVLLADMPGFCKKEMNIHIDNGVLNIDATKSEIPSVLCCEKEETSVKETPKKGKGSSSSKESSSESCVGMNLESLKPSNMGSYYRRERSWGKLHRSYKLPVDADSNGDIKVKYTDGVLCCIVPKVSNTGPSTTKLIIH